MDFEAEAKAVAKLILAWASGMVIGTTLYLTTKGLCNGL